MADETSDKQPEKPGEEPAPAPAEEFDPEWEWHRRAHPGVVSRPLPPPSPAPKPAAPAAPAKPTPAAAEAAAGPAAPQPGAPKPAVPPPAARPAGEPPKAAPPSGSPPEKPAAPPAGAPPSPKPHAPAGAAPPKPPAPPKEAPPKPEPLDNELVKRFRGRFGQAIREAWTDRKQAILVVEAGKLRDVALYARDEEKFNLLADLTAVDWLKREKRFDVVLNLYSFAKNERLRLKAHAGEGEKVPSVVSVWGGADWLERECYDMFGIVFDGHPNLKRILLPDDWQGHPLRKDYDILTQDTAWVRENLGIESGQ